MTEAGLKKVVFRDIFIYFAIACILCCTSIILISYYSYKRISQHAIEESVISVENAIRTEQNKLSSLISSFSVWTQSFQNIVTSYNEAWIKENIASDLNRNFGVEFSAVILDSSSRKMNFYAATGESTTSFDNSKDWNQLLQNYFASTKDIKKPFSTLFRLNNRPYLLAINEIGQPNPDGSVNAGGKYLAVALAIDADFLQKISTVYFIDDLRYVEQIDPSILSSTPHYRLESFGKIDGYLIWKPKEVGSTILKSLIPIGLGAIFLLCLIAIVIIRRVSHAAESYDDMLKELIKTTSTITAAKSQAESSSAAKTKFLSTMSHEIRTPMNGIVGMISLLKETELDQQQKSYVNTIQISADSLMSMLDSILEFSRLESGINELVLSEINLHKLLMEVHGLLTPVAIQKKLQFDVFYSEDTPKMVRADPVKLRQILLHLTTNALKFTNAGSVKINVVSSPLSDGKTEFIFQIIDTGIGIAEGIRESLFEGFFQVDSNVNRQFDGAGLGLGIVKNLVSLMKGKVGVDSKLGQGSIFWFSIVMESASEQKKEPLKQFSRPLSLLLIDENTVNQEISRNMLLKTGAHVDSVPSKKEAEKALEKKKYDAVVLRLDATASNYAKDISSIQKPNLPIIALLNQNVLPDNFLQHDCGLDQTIPQPITLKKIQDALQNLVKSGKISLT